MTKLNRLLNRVFPGGLAPTALVLGMLFLVGCSDSTTPILTLWEGTLSPVPPSRITGQIAAVTQLGRTEVSIEIRLAEADSEYAWRVETGDCLGEGDIQGGPLIYPPLTAGESGLASSRAFLAVLFRSGSSLAVKVYAEEGDQEVLVSCGVLVEI